MNQRITYVGTGSIEIHLSLSYWISWKLTVTFWKFIPSSLHPFKIHQNSYSVWLKSTAVRFVLFNLIYSHKTSLLIPNYSFLLAFWVKLHCVKSVRIRSYSALYFPAFGLNTERYFLSLRIQSECKKMQTRITKLFHSSFFKIK